MARLTHLGGPTVLIELDGWRILTDPTFDPPGRTYRFGLGTSSTKTTGPALDPDDLGPIDVILLSHDHHADNLDDRGRLALPRAATVITTLPGARRLGASHVGSARATCADCGRVHNWSSPVGPDDLPFASGQRHAVMAHR